MMKIRKQAQKVKTILSANDLIPVHITSLHDDIDFQYTITRKDFEVKREWGGVECCV